MLLMELIDIMRSLPSIENAVSSTKYLGFDSKSVEYNGKTSVILGDFGSEPYILFVHQSLPASFKCKKRHSVKKGKNS